MVKKPTTKQSLSTLQVKHDEVLVELELYKLLVDSVQDYAIFYMDTNGYVQTWNKGAQKNKGYSAKDIIGKHFSTFYQQVDKNNHKPEKELEIALRDGRVEDEGWRVRKDGSKFWANVIITALYGVDGKHVGFAKVTRDLTSRKHHEDGLRKANLLLKKQQRELRVLNESKDEFISLASHQLRTPATGVKQYVGMLVEGLAGPLQPNQQSLLENAYESNERQLHIISDLLKVAQVDAGKVKLKKKQTNVSQLVSQVIDEQHDTFSKRQQAITYQPDSKGYWAKIDPNLTRMVFENIINNASKYSHENSTVAVIVRQEGSNVCVDVLDQGVGFSPKDEPRLFEKFSRIENPLSTKVGGNGLGLYWAKKIVDLHKGKISYKSQLGKGSIFTVILPKKS